MKRVLQALAIMAIGFPVSAQGVCDCDSTRFFNAMWEVTVPDSVANIGIYRAHTALFGTPQSVEYIKFPLDSFVLVPAPHEGLQKVSEVGAANNALAAINAGYWNMDTDTPATYIRVGGVDLSATEPVEAYRVNGYVVLDDGRFDIGACDTTQYAAMAASFDNIVTCGPLLIDDGVELDYSGRGSFFSNRHPRSVIGLTPDRQVIFLVVDGRIPGEAAGMSIPELTRLCRWLEMTDALNLDGGGSSTIWTSFGGVVNHPSDNRSYDRDGERNVSSSILASHRKAGL